MTDETDATGPLMAARYHPLKDGIWDNPHLDGSPFEERAFFIFLFSNHRLRPSGIYRASDEQLAADTGLAPKVIGRYLADLDARGRVIRDAGWVFVVGYLSHQPHNERLLAGVASDVLKCTSRRVLEKFHERYPLLDRWSTDRLLMVSQWSPNGLQTVGRPCVENAPTEQFQSSAVSEQSRAVSEQRNTANAADGLPTVSRPSPDRLPTFTIAPQILDALDRAPKLGAVTRLRSPHYWQAEVRANGDVHFPDAILAAEAWLTANPTRAPRKDLSRFLHNWLTRAHGDLV